MDILLGGVDMKAEKAAARKTKVAAMMNENKAQQAPIELMSEFLLKVSGGEIKEALKLCEVILKYEPGNLMMREYKVSMAEYVRQGLDDEESESDDDGEEDDVEGSGDDGDDDRRKGNEFKMAEVAGMSESKGEGKAGDGDKSSDRWRRP